MKISSVSELATLEIEIRRAAASTVKALGAATARDDPLDVLRAIKFREIGFDPLQPDRPLNLVEQVNQSFTYLVSLHAVAHLLERHPASKPFHLNLGARSGTDIFSDDGLVAAEVFAAVSLRNNAKLKKDVIRMRKHPARYRYVFFYSEAEERIPEFADVAVIRVDIDSHLSGTEFML